MFKKYNLCSHWSRTILQDNAVNSDWSCLVLLVKLPLNSGMILYSDLVLDMMTFSQRLSTFINAKLSFPWFPIDLSLPKSLFPLCRTHTPTRTGNRDCHKCLRINFKIFLWWFWVRMSSAFLANILVHSFGITPHHWFSSWIFYSFKWLQLFDGTH